jgi:hypothetical protein
MVFSEGQFVNGLREGHFKIYDELGNNIRTLLFDNNQKVKDTGKLTTAHTPSPV